MTRDRPAEPQAAADPPNAGDLLPLPPHVFQILLSLLDRERHGYALLQDIDRRTDGEMRLGTSTLYAAIKRMVAAGLIEETEPPSDEESTDERRRYYRATPFGRAVAREEALRIGRLHRMIKDAGVLDRPPASARVEP